MFPANKTSALARPADIRLASPLNVLELNVLKLNVLKLMV
jgi:hypothetical protein